jgi:hypothetical protein
MAATISMATSTPPASGLEPNTNDGYRWKASCQDGVMTAEYRGGIDTVFDSNAGDPANNHIAAHFTWDEKVSRRLSDLSLIAQSVKVDGNTTSTWAGFPQFDCTGEFSKQPNAPVRIAVRIAVSADNGVQDPGIYSSALLPYDGEVVKSSGPSGGNQTCGVADIVSGHDFGIVSRTVVLPFGYHASDLSSPYKHTFDYTNEYSSNGQDHYTDDVFATYTVTVSGGG